MWTTNSRLSETSWFLEKNSNDLFILCIAKDMLHCGQSKDYPAARQKAGAVLTFDPHYACYSLSQNKGKIYVSKKKTCISI